MSDSYSFNRRQVLSATGAAIVGGLWATGSAAADDGRTYTADLTGEAVGVDTAAAGTATVTVDDGEASYELWVSCLRNGTRVTVSTAGEAVAEHDLEGPVTDGLVRDETILEGTTDADALLDAFDGGEVTVTVHTEQYPDGEIGGPFAADEVPDDSLEEPDEEENEDDEDPGEEEENGEEEEPDPDVEDALEVVDKQVGVGHDTDNEYILFKNTSDAEIDLGGYVVTDREEGGTGIEATFPDEFTLESGEQVRVTSGSGEPTDDEIFMDSGRAVWREDGDVVLVLDPDGSVVFRHEYGDGGVSAIQFVFNQVRSLFA